MQLMNEEIRAKICNYIKSKIDISDIIKDYHIKNEDLSYAIIFDFNRSGQDISNCNLTGIKAPQCNLMNAIAKNAIFSYSDISSGNCRNLVAVGANFMRANCKDTDFCLADLRSCNLCDITITFSARYLYKTKVSKNVHDLLDRIWIPIDDNTTMQFSEQR